MERAQASPMHTALHLHITWWSAWAVDTPFDSGHHDQFLERRLYMKGKNLQDLQQSYKESVVGLCIVCDKPTSGWYGRWGNLGTCSKKCEQIQEAKPKYLGPKGDSDATLP